MTDGADGCCGEFLEIGCCCEFFSLFYLKSKTSMHCFSWMSFVRMNTWGRRRPIMREKKSINICMIAFITFENTYSGNLSFGNGSSLVITLGLYNRYRNGQLTNFLQGNFTKHCASEWWCFRIFFIRLVMVMMISRWFACKVWWKILFLRWYIAQWLPRMLWCLTAILWNWCLHGNFVCYVCIFKR